VALTQQKEIAMPKARSTTKIRGFQGNPIRVAMKIGGRSSTRSALRMSNEELLELYNSKGTRGKDRNKIKKVLESRGIDPNATVDDEFEAAEEEFQLEMG
jgi:hypothetical protein